MSEPASDPGREPGSRPESYVRRLRAVVGHDPLFLPAACCAVLEHDDDGSTRVLLQQRGEPGGPWGLPGGALELGETVSQAAVRETLEETGLVVEPHDLLGVFSGPRPHTYPNGDVVQSVVTALVAGVVAGELRADGTETVALGWFRLDALPTPLFGPHELMLEALVAGDRGVWD
ncbi:MULTISPECIES: NUDIX domain-containing protein [unclassified Isoptericola]|uniref:NUDIX domain-containing protein n=1 Tax=unclassified Isoptericola TaxID=2623355 RepID=UPI00365A73F2